MVKRELSRSNGANDVKESHSKRTRRDTAGSSSDVDVTMSDPVQPENEGHGERSAEDPDVVKEQGLKLWQTVKDAVKDDRSLSLDFLRRPSKRLYPDYYQIIKQPIALDDIKKQIETGKYASLEAVRQDFELCFNNAKQYNMKDSNIWRDAKELLRVVNKSYNKIVPPIEDGENAEGEDGKKGKSKGPNLNRLIKSRLQKLVDKGDASGRIMSTEFMELPSKKEWPVYYKEIKKPQCLENIFKRIKRKEYMTPGDFAADVELVFSNAMAFNQEHTPIWEDALALRDYFRLLMSDLPQPYALPEYAKPSNTKIKIKPQNAQASGSASSPPAPKAEPSASSSLLLRVPAMGAMSTKATTQRAPTPAVRSPAAPASASLPVVADTPQLPAQSQVATTPKSAITTTQPIAPTTSFINNTFAHYPNHATTNVASTPVAQPLASTSTSIPALTSIINSNSLSKSNSPAPPLHPAHQLKSIALRIQPRGRALELDHRDGVKSWAMRLENGETGLLIGGVAFLGNEDDESSGDEEVEHDDIDKEEEEESPAAKNGRRKGKGKARGRQTRASAKAAPTKIKPAAKKKDKLGEVQLKLNGLAVKETGEHSKEWDVHLPAGSNVLEVGETGGLVWKVYIEKLG